jgi:protoporphyrin/coproporphyrin ferrochelatase
MMPRTAVVLLNLGGPDSLAAVQPFLFNLFADPDIFKLPFARFTQRPFAAIFSRRRTPDASRGYAAIGGKSPLLEYTRAQADALQRALGANRADVHICMRYWHPMAPEVVQGLKQAGYAHVILLPLYPQYSHTTTGSSRNDFERECRRQHYRPTIQLIRYWYDHPAYQQAITEMLRAELTRLPEPDPERVDVLFSAHGLPQKLVDAGDPYEQQIQATYESVRQRLGWPHTTLCYQSRVGPLKWLKPYTDEVIRQRGRAGTRQMLVYPIAFVSDHVETLYELGMLYAGLARECGITHYRVVPALNTHPLLIDALTDRILHALPT